MMYALQLNEFGLPSNLKYVEVKAPQITSPYQVIVKVIAAGVNPIEWKIRRGNVSLVNFLLKFPAILGNDFSGIIYDKGDKVTEFDIGDEVFGKTQNPFSGLGTYAQYTLVNTKNDGIIKKPSSITHQEAAGFGIAGLTAWTGLVSIGDLKVDEEAKDIQQKVLVIGASGGVGTYAVQIAKHVNNAHVTAICSGENAELVKKLGADRVIDYTQQDFGEVLKKEKESFDLVLDCIGGDTYYSKSIPILKLKGNFVTAVGPDAYGENIRIVDIMKIGMITLGRKVFGVRNYKVIVGLTWRDLPKIVTYLDKRKIVTVIGHEFDLKDGVKAHELSESHRVVGKIILNCPN
ncbi:hypothetical protein C1645_772849 [Glomus cerebriforme]|uniref:Enoyl reductase (ER) domain-containing protein n=1 Tax=Glomus cerebriforme TaxID=658196 RepID=A0A397SU68_9GLOM|nr:hypothetical protein C1645_772849 [Glomus cerebriforme]